MYSLFLIFNLPFGMITGLIMSHYYGNLFVTLPFIILYLISPILDMVSINFFPRINRINFYRYIENINVDLCVKLYPFLQLAIFSYLLFDLRFVEVLSLEFILKVTSFGVVCGGTGLMIGHELMHRDDKLSQVGTFMLTYMASYMHWPIEHIKGHHKNVATILDPCTARKGEKLYAFLFRSIIGQVVSAFEINKSRFIKLWSSHLMITIVLTILLGPKYLIMLALQSIIAVLLLENVNYVEHYGLERKLLSNGKYSKVTNEHSWDSHSILTNMSLINLGFHADHHANINKEFYKLETHNRRVLPLGIPSQLLISMIPSLWFKFIHPKLKAI